MINHACECLATFGAVLERLGSVSMRLEASWPHLVILLGLSGDVLGRPKRIRCVSKGVLRRLLGVLTSSTARLGRVLGRLETSLGRLDPVLSAAKGRPGTPCRKITRSGEPHICILLNHNLLMDNSPMNILPSDIFLLDIYYE